MKNILIPMDFSEVGINALRYALELFPDASYSVLHVRSNILDMSEPFPIKEQKLPLDIGIFNEQDWRDAMYKYIKQNLSVEKIPTLLTVNIKYGAISLEINKYIGKVDFDAIVMGTRDKYNYFDKVLGTVSFEVAKTCTIPMYLIPRYASFSGFNNVLAAIDHGVDSESYFDIYRKWNSEFSAYTKFLYVKPKVDNNAELRADYILNKLFKESEPKFEFEIDEIVNDKIGQSLLALAYDFKSDLLVVMPKEQGLFGSLFSRSISKDLIVKAEVPVLFIKNEG